MCLIVDANLASSVFVDPPIPLGAPILRALKQRKATAWFGGTKMLNEYKKLDRVMRVVRSLFSRGSVKYADPALVDREQAQIEQEFAIKSDDPHILALARISRARLLCTHDDGLIDDFRNPKLINKPRGRVYKSADHANLIRTACRSGRQGRRPDGRVTPP